MPGAQPSVAELTAVDYISGIGSNGASDAVSYATWDGDSPATYATTYSTVHKWNNDAAGNAKTNTSAVGSPGGTVTYAFNPNETWTAAQQQAFVATLTLWADETNISFVATSNTTAADVLFSLGQKTGTYESSRWFQNQPLGSTSISSILPPSSSLGGQSTVTFDTSGGFGTLGSFAPSDSYAYASLVHEVGHLLGLGHSGPYSDNGSGPASYDSKQQSAFDSKQWSVMSYIQPTDTAAKFYSQYTVTGTNWTATTTTTSPNGGTIIYYYSIAPQAPMPLDILAMQRLYGAPAATALSGGQVFGFNCNVTDAAEPFFDFAKNVDPVITLWDAGTGNTLDLSGYTTASVVNLNAGAFSSAGALTNNIGIAFGTQIDTAIGGSGNDVFTVNADNDVINGGGGTNTVVFAANRSQYAISGDATSLRVTDDRTSITDTLSNVQSLQFADTTVSSNNYAVKASSDYDGDGKSDILFQNVDGTIDNWEMNGSAIGSAGVVANPDATWHAVGSGDFNGDGIADILFQNDNGSIDIWEMNGHAILSSAIVANPGTTWHAVGTGDFNGDGKSDILFQNDNGSVDIWSMSGQSIASSAVVANPGTTWHAVGTGDFNGDGKSDILFQNDDGTIDIWNMNGSTMISSGIVANPFSAWHAVGTGDFNGDGKSDIVFQNNDGRIDIWDMNGNSILSSTVIANPGPAWHAVSTGDYNGDGRSDILFQNDNGAVDVWTMNDAAIITSSVVTNPSTAWQTVGLGGIHFIDGTQSSGTFVGTISNDDFVFTTSTAGSHAITGFDILHDVITLDQARFGSYAAVQANETQVSGSTIINLGNGSTLTLAGVLPAALGAKNFI